MFSDANIFDVNKFVVDGYASVIECDACDTLAIGVFVKTAQLFNTSAVLLHYESQVLH